MLTGAGISQESGVPTFRGAGGLWRDHRPEDLATQEAFARNPRLVWEWYRWRREIVTKAAPNAGHVALAAMERLVPGFLIATQNVDGLHQRAGSERVVELHGSILRTRCAECGRPIDGTAGAAVDAVAGEDGPQCACGGLGRPDVVWFGETLPEREFRLAAETAAAAALLLVVGTSSVVYPAASLAEIGQASGARLVVVNPERTPLLALADEWISATAAVALPALAALVAEGDAGPSGAASPPDRPTCRG